ncbi:hypothetical protein [Acidocella aminolytica]|uniref:Uncharacterized protein n=1 Tax=Acidocella aminolytica 101 = DSM 11237 TaxID=1120923 RepID=A0A0D6PDF7_9PROT|nr:hypothetical protein [Acidocella aminolytica]GAN79790.1 hypothetical protein Aam_030_023 [Acidocella aminolytica 101 = DSM 11237]GBQ32057.1 hypothetical protein AA11237_0058 [Acidocella aminolytica 101 = DSM 11237]SHF35535.1 hypothetical protein SAMN02746095_02942 [Acidocella aminolytica 101 = DSM 11237]
MAKFKAGDKVYWAGTRKGGTPGGMWTEGKAYAVNSDDSITVFDDDGRRWWAGVRGAVNEFSLTPQEPVPARAKAPALVTPAGLAAIQAWLDESGAEHLSPGDRCAADLMDALGVTWRKRSYEAALK